MVLHPRSPSDIPKAPAPTSFSSRAAVRAAAVLNILGRLAGGFSRRRWLPAQVAHRSGPAAAIAPKRRALRLVGVGRGLRQPGAVSDDPESGAAAFGRRSAVVYCRASHRHSRGRATEQLQYGHGRPTAENCSCGDTFGTCPGSLQCGHGRSTVKNVCAECGKSGELVASMRPRSVDRGERCRSAGRCRCTGRFNAATVG